jgi:hypothetical protein
VLFLFDTTLLNSQFYKCNGCQQHKTGFHEVYVSVKGR